MSVHEPTGIFFGKVKNRLRDFGFEVFFLHNSQYYYPTLLVDVQKMHKRSTNIPRYYAFGYLYWRKPVLQVGYHVFAMCIIQNVYTFPTSPMGSLKYSTTWKTTLRKVTELTFWFLLDTITCGYRFCLWHHFESVSGYGYSGYTDVVTWKTIMWCIWSHKANLTEAL